MGLESATFIDDLDTSNPASGDQKKQGDDHLRLIKSVLKNSIKRVSRAFYVPNTVAKSANYTVLAADDNKTIVCDTTSPFTLTLPTGLTTSDAGWCIYVLKTTTDANPVWIAPSGTINGYTKVRRSVLGFITKVLWTGTVFIASRPATTPVGSLIEFYGTSLPQGCLWPDGATFTAADYVELNTALGGNTKPDKRGKIAAGKTDMGGSDVGGITTSGSGVDGLTLKATGGAQSVTVSQANLPAVTLATTVTDPGHTHVVPGGASGANGSAEIVLKASSGANNVNSLTAFTGITASTALGGSGTALNKMPPTIIANFVLVAE